MNINSFLGNNNNNNGAPFLNLQNLPTLNQVPFQNNNNNFQINSNLAQLPVNPIMNMPILNNLPQGSSPNIQVTHNQNNNNENSVTSGNVMLPFPQTMTQPVSRASPSTIRWLLKNFEPSTGISLPRAVMYQHYSNHALENNIEKVNAASFGKLVRSVFVGLRTRRLGTRGNSKYHYYGIRMKPDSELHQKILPGFEDIDLATLGGISSGQGNNNGSNSSNVKIEMMTDLNSDDNNMESSEFDNMTDSNTDNSPTGTNNTNNCNNGNEIQEKLLKIPQIINQINQICQHFNLNDLSNLEMVKNYAESVICNIISLNFNAVEPMMDHFYHMILDDNNKVVASNNLPKWLENFEITIYQGILDIMFPNILTVIDSESNDFLRSFSKVILPWLKKILNSCQQKYQAKNDDHQSILSDQILLRANKFSKILKRLTLKNHLHQNLTNILGSQSDNKLVLVDLNKLDLDKICEDCWISENLSKKFIITQFENMKEILANQEEAQKIIEEWHKIIVEIVEKHLAKHSSKDLIVTWNFLASTIVRDLTLRSAQSFGSVLILRLFLDEFVQLIVLQAEAKRIGCPIMLVHF